MKNKDHYKIEKGENEKRRKIIYVDSVYSILESALYAGGRLRIMRYVTFILF